MTRRRHPGEQRFGGFSELPADLMHQEPPGRQVSAVRRGVVSRPASRAEPEELGDMRAIDVLIYSFSTGVVSKVFLQPKLNREYLAIQNNAGIDLWYNFNVQSGVNLGFKIADNSTHEWYYKVPNGSVYVFGATASLNFSIMEG